MTMDFSVILVYDFGLLSQNLRPCHMDKCHVGSKADMALTWQRKRMSQNEFWPAQAHIVAASLWATSFFWADIAWPIF